jgi:hypothetical protein
MIEGLWFPPSPLAHARHRRFAGLIHHDEDAWSEGLTTSVVLHTYKLNGKEVFE